MANLVSRSAVDDRWYTWGLGVLSAFRTAQIEILYPNRIADGDDFDPYAGPQTATDPSTLIWSGPAQLAVYRQTLNADDVAGSVAHLRSVRFTIDLGGVAVPLRKGLLVHVTSCPHDPAAEGYEYVVTSAIGSGNSWLRTLEAEADQGVYVP